MDTSIALAVFAGITIILSILTARTNRRLDRLEKDKDRQRDQSTQLLHRASEAITARNKATIYLQEYIQAIKEDGKERDDDYFTKREELSAAENELRGIAIYIGNKEMLNLINQSKEGTFFSDTGISISSQKLHTLINKLLAEKTSPDKS